MAFLRKKRDAQHENTAHVHAQQPDALRYLRKTLPAAVADVASSAVATATRITTPRCFDVRYARRITHHAATRHTRWQTRSACAR